MADLLDEESLAVLRRPGSGSPARRSLTHVRERLRTRDRAAGVEFCAVGSADIARDVGPTGIAAAPVALALRLPLKALRRLPIQRRQPAGPTQQGSRRTRVNPIRVMVVDDSVVVRKIVTDVLSADPDIEVVGTAVNGRIAVAKIEQLKPDLVTMDIEMPEMNGIEAVRAIRAHDGAAACRSSCSAR